METETRTAVGEVLCGAQAFTTGRRKALRGRLRRDGPGRRGFPVARLLKQPRFLHYFGRQGLEVLLGDLVQRNQLRLISIELPLFDRVLHPPYPGTLVGPVRGPSKDQAIPAFRVAADSVRGAVERPRTRPVQDAGPSLEQLGNPPVVLRLDTSEGKRLEARDVGVVSVYDHRDPA